MFSDDVVAYALQHRYSLMMNDSIAVSGLASMFVSAVQREIAGIDAEKASRYAVAHHEMSPVQIVLKRYVNIWNLVCDELEKKHGMVALKRDGIKSVFVQVFSISEFIL